MTSAGQENSGPCAILIRKNVRFFCFQDYLLAAYRTDVTPIEKKLSINKKEPLQSIIRPKISSGGLVCMQ